MGLRKTRAPRRDGAHRVARASGRSVGSTKVVLLGLGALAGLLLLASPAHAEGSRELTSQGGDRAFLWHRTSGGLHSFGGIPAQSAIRVYAKAGERILLGSSAAGIDFGTINYTRPNGTTGTCGAAGRIDNRSQELVGPTGPGSYNPCSITVGATEAGVWQIRFISPGSASGGVPSGQSATSNWTQSPAVSWIAAWDVTVRNTANNANIPGRVYANYLSQTMGTGFGAGSTGRLFTPHLHVQTRDGSRFRYDYNGLDPLTFITFANNKGFVDSSGNPLYRSVQLTTSDAFQAGQTVKNPGSADTAADVTHKLFVNEPASDLPTSATMGGGSTWLVNPPASPPNVSNLTFTGSEGTLNQAGYGQGGTFEFDTDPNTAYRLVMDINGDGNFGNSTDRIFTGYTASGLPQVNWDGKDGSGSAVDPGATGIAAEVTVYTGEVHFPLLDTENNPSGAIIERTIPSTDYTVYYDDRGLSGGTPPSPLQALAGESSQTGSHEWSRSYGDHKGVDTWFYGAGRTLSMMSNIEIKNADLAMTKTDGSTQTASGEQITYTLTVTNNGPSDVEGISLTDVMPQGITNVDWSCQITTGTGSCGTGTGTGDVSTSLDLSDDAVATVSVTGTVAADAPAVLSNTASVTRPADVADPDASNDSATDTTSVNRRPVAVDKSYSTNEDQPLTVSAPGLLGGASDLDGQTLTAEIVAGPSHGSVSVSSNGSFTYTPATNYNGQDSFTFRVCDNGTPTLCSTAQNATLTVDPVNDSPAAQNDVAATNEDTAVEVNTLANDTDVDGHTLSITEVSAPSHGTAEKITSGTNAGQIRYTPNGNYNGPDSFSYTVSDGNGGTATATVNVTVAPVNDAPAGQDDSKTTDEDMSVDVNVLANDTDAEGHSLSVASVSSPSHGSAQVISDGPNAGQVRYTPHNNYNGPDSFNYTVSDGNGGTATATVNVTVNSINDAPTASDDDYATGQGATLTADGATPNPAGVLANDQDAEGTLEVKDADANQSGVQPTSRPAHGTLTLNANGTFEYVPDAGFLGEDSFTYQACDSGGQCDQAVVVISVAISNGAPSAQDDFGSLGEAAAVSNAFISQYKTGKANDTTRLYGINAASRPYTFVKKGKEIPRPLNALGYRSTNHSLYGYRLKKSPGVVKVNPKTGAAKYLGNPKGLPASGAYIAGDVSPDGKTYYVYASKSGVLWKVDLKRFRASKVKLSSKIAVPDLAVSPKDGKLYGVDAGGRLLKVDPRSGRVVAKNVSQLGKGTYGATWFTSTGDLIAYENGARSIGTLTWISNPTKSPEVVSKQSGPSTRGNDGAAYVAPPKMSGLSVVVDVLANDDDPDGSLNLNSLRIVEQPSHGTVRINSDKTITYTSGSTYKTNDSFEYEVCDSGNPAKCATATVSISSEPI